MPCHFEKKNFSFGHFHIRFVEVYFGGHIDLQFQLSFKKIEKLRKSPCLESNPHCSKRFVIQQLDCKSRSQYYYCFRFQGLKETMELRDTERISSGSVEIFSFLNVIFNDFSSLYYLNFNICYPTSSYITLSFKKLKLYWDREPDRRARGGGQITQTPLFTNCIIQILMQKVVTISQFTRPDQSNHTNRIIQIVPCKTTFKR